jgi:exopolysaccharide production protein ExoY
MADSMTMTGTAHAPSAPGDHLAQVCEKKVSELEEAVPAGTYERAQERLGRPEILIQLALKRLMDIVGSGMLILILAPVLITTALWVKFSSKGPMFFSQKRWGLDESRFGCLKFRSMYTEQDKIISKHKVSDLQSKGILLKDENDPRVTPVGRVIRKTSIDELPQLFNVLFGHMSLVGPRPLVTYMLDPFHELRKVRCMMRPGITGLWQIYDRENNQSALQMQPYDLRYVQEFNLWLDLKLLLKTPGEVIRGAGAH